MQSNQVFKAISNKQRLLNTNFKNKFILKVYNTIDSSY